MADPTSPESEGTALETGASVWDDLWAVEAHITAGLNENSEARHWLKKNGLQIVVEDSQNTKFASPERVIYAVNNQGLRAKLYYVLEQGEDISVNNVVSDICGDITRQSSRVYTLGSPSFPSQKGDTSYPSPPEVKSWSIPPTCATDALRTNGRPLPYPIIPSVGKNQSPELVHYFYKQGYDVSRVKVKNLSISNPVRVNGNFWKGQWKKDAKQLRQDLAELEQENTIIGVINIDGQYSHIENQWEPTWNLRVFYVPNTQEKEEISDFQENYLIEANVINSAKEAVFVDSDIDINKVSFERPKQLKTTRLSTLSLPCGSDGLVGKNSYFTQETIDELKWYLEEYSNIYIEIEVSENDNAILHVYVLKDELKNNSDGGVGGGV